jgi:hypothetical protein
MFEFGNPQVFLRELVCWLFAGMLAFALATLDTGPDETLISVGLRSNRRRHNACYPRRMSFCLSTVGSDTVTNYHGKMEN